MREESAVSARLDSTNARRSGHRSPVLASGLLIAILLPAVMANLILYWQSFSLPFRDDYRAILDFAIMYRQSLHWTSKVAAIVGHQYNEYKLIFEHLIVGLELELTGRLSFGFLIAIGNLFLLPFACLLWRIHVLEEGRSNWLLIQFLPISFFFFSLTYWETLDWAMTGLANIPVLFFVLLSIKLLFPTAPKRAIPLRFLWSCISAIFAVFSSASGFLLAPVGFLILVRRKAFAASAIWCASFLVALPIYLYHYVPVHREPPADLARGLFFFAFLGCALPNAHAAATLGVVLAIIFLLSVRSGFERTHPVSFHFAVWIFGCAALVSWVRAAAFSRYSVFSVLLLIFAYKFLCHYLPGHFRGLTLWHVMVPSLVFAVVLCVSSDLMAYKYLGERKQVVLTGMNRYITNPDSNSPMIDPREKKLYPGEDDYERLMLTRAIQSGVFPKPTLQNLR